MLSAPISNYHKNQSTYIHPHGTMSTKRGLAAMGNGDGGHNDEDHLDKKFKVVSGDGDEDDDDDEDDEGPKNGKRAGRRKIEIRYIEDKSRRHITFSKRKSGIMKKAYELSTLTGTQVLLLVVSETGLVYTFTTPKLQPLVTKAEGKNLIQACLHAPDKEPTPEYAPAQDEASPAPNSEAEREEQSASPAQASAQLPTPSQVPQQQQQQQQAPGGYGSSSSMTVPTYPPPYNHIPFPTQAGSYYPPMGMPYPNNGGHSGPPPAPAAGGYPNQYWSGPPGQPAQQAPTSQPQAGPPPTSQPKGRKDK
ncbi:transcription factor of the MADS box [Podila horticola]|nr:transcription factor of the MADS box [Podila horticola]KAG0334470.1 transcription factor of the MADS box [Podila horticola]